MDIEIILMFLKKFFVGIWGYASDSFYPTNYYEYFNSFYNSFEETWVKASNLQVDLSEVNGILDTTEFSICETKEFWVSWKVVLIHIFIHFV